MYIFLISAAIYSYLSYILMKRSKYVGAILIYGAAYFFFMFLLNSHPSEFMVKTYFSLAFFIDAVGIYVLSSIITDNRKAIYSFTGVFLFLGIVGAYLTFSSVLTIDFGGYFFKINISQYLWYYSQYALFYPGIIIIFFLGIVGLENIESHSGKNLLIFAVQSFTFGVMLYFTIIDTIYALTFYLLNLFGALMILIWEVGQRYR